MNDSFSAQMRAQQFAMQSCAGCSDARRKQRDAESKRDHVLRMGGWRIVLASILDEARRRLLDGER
jgi:hypothetical protein